MREYYPKIIFSHFHIGEHISSTGNNQLLKINLFYVLQIAKTETVQNNANTRKSHQGTSSRWSDLSMNVENLQDPCGQRNTNKIIDKGPEKILPNHSNRETAQFDGFGKSLQIIAHQRNPCNI